MASTDGESATLKEILNTLHTIQADQNQLAAAVDAIGSRVDLSASLNNFKIPSGASNPSATASPSIEPISLQKHANGRPSTPPPAAPRDLSGSPSVPVTVTGQAARRSSVTSRIILTTYPGQSGIDPLPMDWGNKDPIKRGPVVVSRHANTIRRRNGIYTLYIPPMHI